MDQHNTFFTTMPPTSYGQTAPSGYIGLPMGSLAPPQSPLSAHHSPHDPMGVSGPYDNSHIQPMAHIPGPHEGQNMYDVSGLSPMMSGPYVPGAMASSLPNPHGGMNMEQPMMHNPMDSQSYHSMQQPMVPVPQEEGYSMMDPMNVGPVDFSSAATNNILTEFTKKRNWPQRLLEEVPDFIHVLSSDGKILYVANSSKALTGYAPEELIGKLIVDFIHEDDAALFWLEFNECMKNQTQFRMYFRLRTKNNGWTVFDVEGHPHFTHSPRNDHLQRLPDADKRGDCAGFFMNARPYPSKNMEMLDSYAEHRIENVRLNRRVHDLKLEEEEDAYGHLSSPSYGDSTPRGYGSVGNSTPHSALSMQHGMVSPLGTAPGPLTKQNLDVSGSSRVDSLDDKMARYGVAHGPDPIEMFTGLRYRDGERSKGLSTGDTSPALLRGDAGVPLPSEPHPRHSGEKKKKQKIAEEYVCTDCATLESPEWRKGPKGPKTLCNACGLRWAKREKKKQQEAQQQQQAANANK